MVKIEELKAEIKETEYQYKKAVEKNKDKAMYMLQRRLIRLRKNLNEYYHWKKMGEKYEG